jgi:hypothetical protein
MRRGKKPGGECGDRKQPGRTAPLSGGASGRRFLCGKLGASDSDVLRRVIGAKIRISNFEILNNFKAPNSNAPNAGGRNNGREQPGRPLGEFDSLGFRILDLFRISCFDIRICRRQMVKRL